MLLLKFNPYISFGGNQFSRCLLLKIQKYCFPLCSPGRGEKEHESDGGRRRGGPGVQESINKLLKLLAYCRKLTVHGQNENIKSIGFSPLCFVLHVVEFYMNIQPWVQKLMCGKREWWWVLLGTVPCSKQILSGVNSILNGGLTWICPTVTF